MKAKVTYLYYLVQTGFLTVCNWLCEKPVATAHATVCNQLHAVAVAVAWFCGIFWPVAVRLHQKRQKNWTRLDFKTLDTSHWIAWGLPFPHEMGMVGTRNDFLALGPALTVQDQKRGWVDRCLRTEIRMAGGMNQALKDPLGKAWWRLLTSERRITHGDAASHWCLVGGGAFPTGDGGGVESRAISFVNICCHIVTNSIYSKKSIYGKVPTFSVTNSHK